MKYSIRYAFFSLVMAVFLGLPPAWGSQINVALNAEVRGTGSFFRISDPLLASVVDGNFLTDGTNWAMDSVCWIGNDQYIQVDLDGEYTLSNITLQADNNDVYIIEYYDKTRTGWYEAATADKVMGPGISGLQPRDIVLSEAFATSALRIRADAGASLDPNHAVSEIQAFGEPVPEPATILLFGFGLAGMLRVAGKTSRTKPNN